MAESRLYDYLYFSFIFSFFCGDLSFLVTEKSGTIHIVRNKRTRHWFIFNSFLNLALLILNAFSLRETLLYAKGHMINSSHLIFIFSKLVMLLYIVQRMLLRKKLLNAASDLWEQLMKFDRNNKMARQMAFGKLTRKSRLKLIIMQTINFLSCLVCGIKFGVDFFGICSTVYLSMVFSSSLYAYHVLYILIDEMMKQLISELNTSESHRKIKELSGMFSDIMEITRRTNGYLSVYIFNMFSFIGAQVMVYVYSLYKFTKGNSVSTAVTVIFYIVSSILYSIGWFVLLAENCLGKVKYSIIFIKC